MGYLLIGLSSFLYIIAFPNWNLSALAWICLVPLFMVCKKYEDDYRQLAIRFFVFGLISSLGVLFWVRHVTVPGYLMLSGYTACYFSVFALLTYTIKRKMGFPLAAGMTWVTMEYLKGILLTGFPWGVLGSTQYLHLSLIQMASITGVYGISFLIVLFNGAVAELLMNRSGKVTLQRYIPLFVCMGLIVGAMGYGKLKIKRDQSELSQFATPFTFSMVQGNVPPILYWDPAYIKNKFETYYDLTSQFATRQTDMVIWPESSIEYEVRFNNVLLEKMKQLCMKVDSHILFGSDDLKIDNERRYYNSAFLLSPEGNIVGKYDKIHLVPFGEYIPLKQLFPFFQKFVPIEENFSSGEEHTLFYLKTEERSTLFSVLICFEDVFPNLVRKFVFEGARFLVNITNDGWFKESHQPYQHAALAVFRAVENNVYLIRCTNTGLSCLINPYGLIEDKIRDANGKDIFVDGFLTMHLDVINNPYLTFYTRFGDVFAILCCMIVGVYASGIVANRN